MVKQEADRQMNNTRKELERTAAELDHVQGNAHALAEELATKNTELDHWRATPEMAASPMGSDEHTSLHIVPPSTSETVPLIGGITNKKNEDRAYDVEQAILSGGDQTGFQPLAGFVRRAPGALGWEPCVKGAEFSDRAAVALLRRPALRTILAIYFILLHLVEIF